MSKKFKNFLLTFVIVVAVTLLGIGGYFLFNNLSKTVVYDLRIVAYGTDSPMNNTDVYLISEKQNSFNISVNISASGSSAYRVTSSDKSVATVSKVAGSEDTFVVTYLKAGETVIKAYSSATAEVYDSFVLTVHEEFASNIEFDDATDDYITMYNDGNEYNYHYTATGALQSTYCNNMLIRVADNYNTDVFESLEVDQESQNLVVKSKVVKADSQQTFSLETYYIDDQGAERVISTYNYYVNFIGYRIKDMQLLLSEDYNFSGDTHVYLKDEENAEATAAAKKNAFLLDGETLVDNIYLTSTVNNLYFKVRIVYTNLTYRDGSVNSEGRMLTSYSSQNSICTAQGGTSYRMNCWHLTLNNNLEGYDSSSVADYFGLAYSDSDAADSFSAKFTITYLGENSSSYTSFTNKSLYMKDTTNNTFKYVYWDQRFRRRDAITDGEGRIVGFDGTVPDCDAIPI